MDYKLGMEAFNMLGCTSVMGMIMAVAHVPIDVDQQQATCANQHTNAPV